jgi:hypothetical protein
MQQQISKRCASAITQRPVVQVVSTRSMFDWAQHKSSLVGPFTKPETTKGFQAMVEFVNEIYSHARSIPKDVPAIDWNYWEKEVKTPGVVAKLRKEYDSLKIESKDSKTALDEATKAADTSFAEIKAVATAYQQWSEQYSKTLNAELSEAQEFKVIAPFLFPEEWFNRMPGVKRHRHQRKWDGYRRHPSASRFWKIQFLPTTDWIKEVRNGRIPAYNELIPQRVGDMTREQIAERFSKQVEGVEKLGKGQAAATTSDDVTPIHKHQPFGVHQSLDLPKDTVIKPDLDTSHPGTDLLWYNTRKA